MLTSSTAESFALVLLAGLARVPPVAALAERTVLPRLADRAGDDFRDCRNQPQPDPRLWRHGLIRPCGVPRHRRLCGRHSVHHGISNGLLHLLAAMSRRRGRAGVAGISLRTSGIYFIMITLAFTQMLYYLGGEPARIRRRRRHAAQGPQPARPARPEQPDRAVLPGLCAGCWLVLFGFWRLVHVALRHGAARLPQQRAAHGLDGLPDAALQAQSPTSSRRWCACWPAC